MKYEHWWNDGESGKEKYVEKNPLRILRFNYSE
jgi:hypothetical protein